MITVSKISAFLRKNWDPIHLGDDGPADEYDSYAPKIEEILAADHGAQAALIASYLTWVRVDQMGLRAEGECVLDARAASLLVEESKSW